MGKKFRRTQATDTAELPHRFDGQESTCQTCQAGLDDARHAAYQQMELSRQTASDQPEFRTFG